MEHVHANMHVHALYLSLSLWQVMIVIPSDGGFGWIVVLASFWLTFVLEGCVMVFSIYKASLKEELNVSQMHVMTIYSFQMGVFFLAGPLNSLIIQWIGFRPSSIIGILSLAVGEFILYLLLYGFVLFGCVMLMIDLQAMLSPR